MIPVEAGKISSALRFRQSCGFLADALTAFDAGVSGSAVGVAGIDHDGAHPSFGGFQ